MREGHGFGLYASSATHETLSRSVIFEAIPEPRVPRRVLATDAWVDVESAGGEALGVSVRPFMVPGKVPLYEEVDGEVPELASESESNLAFEIDLGDQRAVAVPGCATITEGLKERVHGADILLFDGTLYRDDEMIEAGLSHKTGRRMGHVSVAEEGGPLEAFKDVKVGRKVLFHINNTNPILAADSPERRRVEAAGWEVAYDGMEVG